MPKKQHLYNPPDGLKKRRMLRTHSTPAEIKLWGMLKGRQIAGLQFRRQFGIGPYILDFYCPALRLCIELDGEVHNTREAVEYDLARTEYLIVQHNVCVLRFENFMAFEYPERIIEEIEKVAKERRSALI